MKNVLRFQQVLRLRSKLIPLGVTVISILILTAFIVEALRVAEEIYNTKISEGYEKFEERKPYLDLNDITITYSEENYQVNAPEKESFEKSTNSRSTLKRKVGEDVLLPTEDQIKQVKKNENDNEIRDRSDISLSSGNALQKKTTGFITYFKGLWSKKKPVEQIRKKVIPIKEHLLNYAFIIEQKCLDLGLTCVIYHKVIVVSGESQKVKALEDFLEDSKSELNDSVCQQLNAINVEKDFTLSPFLYSMRDLITKKAEEFKISHSFGDYRLGISGPHESINNMLTYLVELEALPARGKFERRDFEDILNNELEESKFVNSNLNDLRAQIDALESTIKINIHEATEKESVVMQEMYDSLEKLRQDFRELEKKEFYPKDFVEENLKVSKDVQANLDEMKKHIENLEAQLSTNPEECFQKESILFISMNDSLHQVKKKIELFEVAMELNFQEAMKEGTKLNSVVTANLSEVGKKVELLHVGMDAHHQKLLAVGEKYNTTTATAIEELTKKVDNIQRRIEIEEADREIQKVSMLDVDQKMAEFMRILESKLKEVPEKQDEVMKTKKVDDDDIEEYIQKEIGVSPFQRDCMKDIMSKTKELNLICDFGYDVILATGYEKSLEKFMVYLHEIEFRVKKSLYPKYWNLHEPNPFSIVTVLTNSEEYQNISRLFSSTMQHHRIIKLERIQNKYLMEHYTINVQKRKEFKPDEPANRMFLFYGTGTVKPETIYGNYDVGFDLQYADDKGYGKGIAFAVNANYSHSRHGHKTPEGNFKLLIADVFVGKSKMCAPGTYYKPPEGYDSISANGVFYMIYNNFHSYPLYQVEYR